MLFGKETAEGGGEAASLVLPLLKRIACPRELTKVFEEAIDTGRLLYQREVATEQLVAALAGALNQQLVERLTAGGMPRELVEDLRRLAVGGLLELGCVTIGYQEEAIKFSRLLTEIDPLTRLLSRERFQRELDTALEYATRMREKLALLWADIDDLRLINDLYGYAVGDAVLRAVAALLEEAFAGRGAVLGRTGSNSFGVLLPGCDLQGALSLAEQTRQRAEKECLGLEDYQVTLSIGVACFPDHGEAANDLMVASELAVLQAKRRGKNQVAVLDPGRGAEVSLNHERSVILREALRDPEGIVPYFQPIVDSSSGAILGFEVLARIRHCGRVLPASIFAEVAEDTNLIHLVTERTLSSALHTLGRRGSGRLVFINCSMREVEHPELLESLAELVAANNLRPDQVVIELTERHAVRDVARVRDFARELQERGMRLALDDFGSGFSSFLYLRQFDCYFAKIEGSLVKDITRSARCKMIVRHIAEMLRSLAIEPIAEWVETEEIAAIMKSFGVNFCQGYYFGPPAPEPI